MSDDVAASSYVLNRLESLKITHDVYTGVRALYYLMEWLQRTDVSKKIELRNIFSKYSQDVLREAKISKRSEEHTSETPVTL